MLAALYKPGNDNLVLDPHYPVHKPKAGEVLVKVLACGVCHTDIAWLSGASLDERTYALGHEICGVPVELGEGVDPTLVQKDKLYIVLPLTPCVHGLTGLPAALNSIGVGKDGGFAEYVTVTVDQLIKVPEGLSAPVAAIAADAGVTAFNAVHDVAGIKHGTNFKVLIFGIGGVGHLAVQYAKYFGATVYACDIKPAARKLAVDLGATQAFDLIELSQQTKNGFTVDITIDCVADSQTFNLAFAALQGNGVNFPPSCKAVILAVSFDLLNFRALDIIGYGIEVLPVLTGPRSAAVASLELFANGAVKAHVQEEPLRNVNKVIDQLRAFEIIGRKVVVPSL